MQIDAVRGTLRVRIGSRFDAMEVARLEEAVAALGPFSRLTIDFSEVHESDDAALARLAGALMRFERGDVALSGITRHQRRLLTYLGLELDGRDVVAA